MRPESPNGHKTIISRPLGIVFVDIINLKIFTIWFPLLLLILIYLFPLYRHLGELIKCPSKARRKLKKR
jgi:hypothetical protein